MEEKKEKKFKFKKEYGVILAVLIVALAIGGFFFWQNLNSRISIDKSEIVAPEIALSADVAGPLEEVMVNEGDLVTENESVARVGDQLIKSKSDGVVVTTVNDIGKNFNPGEPVVTIVNPAELRVVAHIEEDKGLKDVRVGQRAIFTVDAYGSKQYIGTVDDISETSRQSGIVFNISDKREVRQFDIKIRYNVSAYPELKNGMSAKVLIYKD